MGKNILGIWMLQNKALCYGKSVSGEQTGAVAEWRGVFTQKKLTDPKTGRTALVVNKHIRREQDTLRMSAPNNRKRLRTRPWINGKCVPCPSIHVPKLLEVPWNLLTKFLLFEWFFFNPNKGWGGALKIPTVFCSKALNDHTIYINIL